MVESAILEDAPLHKYDGGGAMIDPLVRCDNCAKLVAVAFIHEHAGCNHCGNKRFNFLYLINEEEMTAIREGSYDFGLGDFVLDDEYLAIFEAVET